MAEEKEFRYLVRIANTDLDGSKQIINTLTKIKGVGFALSNAICNKTGIEKTKNTGYLTDEEIRKIKELIENPEKSFPPWLLNRQKDPETGEDKHLLTGELKFSQDNDIKIMKKVKSYRGMRHAAGLHVRGQRTRSNFRKNKGKVSLGVKKREGVKTGRP